MKYKLIIFDIDGTITTHVSSWQLIHEKLKIWDDQAKKYQDRFLAGRLSYKRFCELDAAHWKGMPEDKLIRIFRKVPYTKNAKICIKRLKKMGFKLAAISTGLQYIADRIKHDLGFDYLLYNRLLSRKGILTGGVDINITHGAKGKIARKILKHFKLQPHEAIAIGDSAGDIPLARACGYSIAFNSTDRELSEVVNYDCKTKDFKDVYNRIVKIS